MSSMKEFTGKVSILKRPKVASVVGTKKVQRREKNIGEILKLAINTITGKEVLDKDVNNIIEKLDMKYENIPTMEQKNFLYSFVTENITNIIDKPQDENLDEILLKTKEIINELDIRTLSFNDIYESLKLSFNIDDLENKKEDIKDYIKNFKKEEIFPDISEQNINFNKVLNEMEILANKYNKDDTLTNNLYNTFPSLDNIRTNYNIQKDIFRNKPMVVKGFYKCKKCQSERTVDYQVQLRRADEPMTVTIQCLDCKFSWKIS